MLEADYGLSLEDKKLIVHFAEGSIRKDGPSAGVAIFTSLYSAITLQTIPCNVAYTGELDVFGYVWPVGGIVEKVFAAAEQGVEVCFIPKANYYNLTEEDNQKLDSLSIQLVPVTHVDEVIRRLFKTHSGALKSVG